MGDQVGGLLGKAGEAVAEQHDRIGAVCAGIGVGVGGDLIQGALVGGDLGLQPWVEQPGEVK